MDDLKLTMSEVKAQRDAAYSECKKMNRIIEDTDKNMRGLSQKQMND